MQPWILKSSPALPLAHSPGEGLGLGEACSNVLSEPAASRACGELGQLPNCAGNSQLGVYSPRNRASADKTNIAINKTALAALLRLCCAMADNLCCWRLVEQLGEVSLRLKVGSVCGRIVVFMESWRDYIELQK
jgi:hypothetical protein